MAQLLAPYHNGMRLGQGFNSYTQQICLDNAVLVNSDENWERVKGNYFKLDRVTLDPNGRTKRITGAKWLTKGSKNFDNDVEEHEVAGGSNHGRPPWTKPQIVTYSSRFVDKLSDVTDSMNISGALSIQTATVGGKGSGSYVDSDKFKESDINFHLQVKVVNQILEFEEYSLFNMIPSIEDKDYPAIYGDSFISGWEEGGEFNAIMSMKVTDKSKIFEVKAHLEANLSLAAVQGQLTADFEMIKNNISKNTETTIAVNWSGGGSIKDPNETWTIESMKKAAAAFPDLVAITPQRTYAILMKYTALESFQRQKQKFTLLQYENAKVYTDTMLDHYMDYKMMWKQLAMASDELEADRASIEWSQIPEDMYELAKVEPIPANEFGVRLTQSTQVSFISASQPQQQHLSTIQVTPPVEADQLLPSTRREVSSMTGQTVRDLARDAIVPDGTGQLSSLPQPTPPGNGTNGQLVVPATPATSSGTNTGQDDQSVPPTLTDNQVLAMQRLDGTKLVTVQDMISNTARTMIQFEMFKPTFAGLILASKVCRVEMAKIVNEVDLLTKRPDLAQDTRRDARFLHPLVFKQLLPIVRSWTDDMLSGGRQATAPIILGYSAPNRQRALPPVARLDDAIKVTPEAMINSIRRIGRKAADYRMHGCIAQVEDKIGNLKGLENTEFFNDLESLDPTYRPMRFSVWQGSDYVLGIEMHYSNGEVKSCGACDQSVPHHRLVLGGSNAKHPYNGLESIFEVRVQSKADSVTKEIYVGSIAVVTTHFKKLDSSQPPNYTPPVQVKKVTAGDSSNTAQPVGGTNPAQTSNAAASAPTGGGTAGQQPSGNQIAVKTDTTKPAAPVLVPVSPHVVWAKPDDGPWSLRGFFGYQHKTTKAIKALGAIFGKDSFVPVPEQSLTPALCRRYYDMDEIMRQQMEWTWANHRNYPGKFLYGRCLRLSLPAATAALPKPSFTAFNDLMVLGLDWKLTKLGFASNQGVLAGLKMVWSSGTEQSWGNYDRSPDAGKWFVNIDTDLVAAKVTTGQTTATDTGRIQSVEFIRAGADHALPPWLLDLSTLRYLGESDASKLINPQSRVDVAPVVDGVKWSIRGFYGWTDGKSQNIVGLGPIWGCG